MTDDHRQALQRLEGQEVDFVGLYPRADSDELTGLVIRFECHTLIVTRRDGVRIIERPDYAI